MDPNWFDKMRHNIEASHADFEKFLRDLRCEVNIRIAEATLAEIEVDEQIAQYQELLQDIQHVAGVEFVEGLAAKVGCWRVEEGEVGIEVLYQPQEGAGIARPTPSTLTAFNQPQCVVLFSRRMVIDDLTSIRLSAMTAWTSRIPHTAPGPVRHQSHRPSRPPYARRSVARSTLFRLGPLSGRVCSRPRTLPRRLRQ